MINGVEMIAALSKLTHSDGGATAIEYSRIVALIVIAAIGVLQFVGNHLS